MSDNFRFAQVQPFTPAGSGAIIGATSIVLSSFNDIAGNPLTMSVDFGLKGYATIEPGNGTQEESISFTGITQNSNGTATLTGVSNVDFLYPYTETSGLATTHAGGVILIITNTSAFYNSFANKFDDETITGTWDFAAVPSSDADPVSGNDLARRSWVLSQVNGGPVSTDSVVIAGVAGETLVAGNLIYLKAADGLWYKTDADTSATVLNVKLGTAQGAGSIGVAITDGILTEGIDDTNTGLVAGTVYYASNTAGGISTSAGTVSRPIGQANAAGKLVFDPYANNPTSLTADQAAALAGTRGTPSSTNKFVTAQNLITSPYDQSQTTQNASVAVGEADSTTKKNKIAQSFTAGSNVLLLRGVQLNKAADTGTFTGTVTVALQADSAGSPSGSNLTSVTITNAVWVTMLAGNFEVPFTANQAIVPGTLYWIVITTSTSDTSNHPNIGSNSAGGYASGSNKVFNTTDGWATNGTVDLYFQTLTSVISVVPQTDATSGLLPSIVLPYSFVDLNTTTVSLVNSTTETTVYTKALPAGFFSANSGIRLRIFFNITVDNQNGPIVTIAAKINGTAANSISYNNNPSGATSTAIVYTGVVEMIILNNNSLSAQRGYSYGTLGGSMADNATTQAPVTFSTSSAGTATINTAVPAELTLTFVSSNALANRGWTYTSVTVEKIG